MVQTVALAINFSSPFHVGWRTVDYIIESFTIHRSLVYASVLVEGSGVKINELVELKASSLLPIIKSGNCYKVLLPLPPLPSRINLKKKGINWITLTALSDILKNINMKGSPFITHVTRDGETRRGGKIAIEYREGSGEQLCFTGRVIHLYGENVGNIPDELFVRVERHVNRLDRVVNAAEPFRVIGYTPLVEMGLILQGDDKLVRYSTELVKLLGELGIGGLRSRGFGKYSVEEIKLCDDNAKLLLPTSKTGRIITLGSYILEDSIDIERSIINRKTIGGYAGPPYDPYILPYLNIVGAGSIIYASKPLTPLYRSISKPFIGAQLIFNPVIAGV